MLKRVSLIIGIIVFVFSALVFAQEKLGSFVCDMVIEHPLTGVTSGKLYKKGDKSRLEMNISGMRTITIIDGQKAYMYMPEQNSAMKLSLAQAKGQVPEIGDYKKNCNYAGEDVIDGKACGVYVCAKGGQPVKMWIPKDSDFPLKVSASGVNTYYKNINRNGSISDDLFVLPAGTNVMDMPQIPLGGFN